jgi:mRNA-degrading endonuclease YafQ of YafQ-DinJ toxin-antitoxin module
VSRRFIAQPKFWRNYAKLPRKQQESAKKAWQIFKIDPFDPRLRTHRINSLSAVFRRTVHAAVVEGDLRVIFYIEGETVVTVNIGSHDVYKT